MDVHLKDFSDPPHVSLTIDETFTLDSEVIGILDEPEVVISSSLMLEAFLYLFGSKFW